MDAIHLQRVFGDIIRGSSRLRDGIYVEHLSAISQAEIDNGYTKAFEDAKSKNLPTNQEKLEFLIKEGIWSQAQEDDLVVLEKTIDQLKNTKKNLFLKSQIKKIDDDIETHSQKQRELITSKSRLLDMTCETYADNKLVESYIFETFHKDEYCKEKYFTIEEFDNLDSKQLTFYVNMYIKEVKEAITSNIKKLAVAPFFQNVFSLCDDNAFYFYGKPIVSLSFFQTELFQYVKYFKFILSEKRSSITDDMLNDPDKIIDMYNTNRTAKKFIKENDSGDSDKTVATSIIGASKEEMKELFGENVTNLNEEGRKRGGLSMADIMDLHGIKKVK